MSCRLFVLVVVLETVADIAIEGDILLRFHQLGEKGQIDAIDRLQVYLSIFAFAHVFQFVVALDAVRLRNTLQFLFLTMFNALFLVYAILQISEIRNTWPQGEPQNSTIPINILTAIIPCVIGVAELAFIVLGWSIWREFGWKVFKLLGADLRIKTIYMHYQIYECLLKFDIFFAIGFSAQLMTLVLQRTDVEYYITVAALPVSLLILIAGHLAARHENKPLMYVFMVGCIAGSGYFGYKLYRIIEHRNEDPYKSVLKSLSTFAALSLVFLLTTFTWACIVMSNFGLGLKNNLSNSKTRSGRSRGSDSRHSRQFSSSTGHRMSIE
ncbi:hypothetical protein SISSUDRAFT_1039843 [Sistotremastrum suecicum HHB10207 ss-3]|uniref:Uncharacterized protein n=1 Tax=Sistotremastrum suecicum HHB10207 ss-3 TaxID=1314776 RepID=A0A166INP4_9AGAM|nr:hypothetical protein SISSUDRAFT_1039843 [Sistotremastrum suecicum HHB10207 ss-3]